MSVIITLKTQVTEHDLFIKVAERLGYNVIEEEHKIYIPELEFTIEKATGTVTVDDMFKKSAGKLLAEYQKAYVIEKARQHRTPILYENETDNEITIVVEVQ